MKLKKWNCHEQSWYVPPGVHPAPFAKWTHGGAKSAARDTNAPDVAQGSSGVQAAPRDPAYLAVPYSTLAAAKAADALWDNAAKSWYAVPASDMAVLEKWRPDNVPVQQAPAMTPREEFAEALKCIGCIIGDGHPIMNGKKQRITVEGEKFRNTSGPTWTATRPAT